MSSLTRDDETRQLTNAREQIAHEFPEIPAQRLDEVFAAIVAGFEGAPVRSYLGVLAHRQARELLRHSL